MNVFSKVALVASCALALGLAGTDCRAQSAEASPTGKGITGGALLGAETVTLVEAAIGVKPAWAYLVGAAVGAGGGGVAGHYLEQGATDPKPVTFLLAGGIALIVPTVIVVLNATRYQPPDNFQHDDGNGDAAELTGSLRDGARVPRLEAPTFLVKQAFTQREMQTFGVRQSSEYHLSLLRVRF